MDDPMWTPATRRRHSRAALRYASDVTDAEWRLLEPLLPPASRRGRRRAWPLREIVNAIFYVLRAGCSWRLLPDSFPPWRTVYRWFARLRDDGVLEGVNHHLVVLDRERVGREASPTAAIIDSHTGGIRL
jgi:putative transposase